MCDPSPSYLRMWDCKLIESVGWQIQLFWTISDQTICGSDWHFLFLASNFLHVCEYVWKNTACFITTHKSMLSVIETTVSESEESLFWLRSKPSLVIKVTWEIVRSYKYAITCAALSQSCRCSVCDHINMHLSGFLNRQALFKHSRKTSGENSSSFIFISLSLYLKHTFSTADLQAELYWSILDSWLHLFCQKQT